MKRSLQRLGAGAAAVALAGVPGVATADQAATVDPKTGPVAYSITAAFQVPNAALAHLVRSPLQAGKFVTPGPERYPTNDMLIVGNDQQSATITLSVNSFSHTLPGTKDTDEKYDPGTYTSVAGLADTLAPKALFKADVSLSSDNPQDTSKYRMFIFFDDIVSKAACLATENIHATTTAREIWVRQRGGELRKIDVPGPGETYTINGVGVKPANGYLTDQNIDSGAYYGDITITHVTKPAGLIEMKGFRLGDHNAVAGWLVKIDHYWVDDKGNRHDLYTSSTLIGAVSCSLPDDFKPLTSNKDDNKSNNKGDKGDNNASGKTGTDTADSENDEGETQVPTHIPSGGSPVGAQPRV